MKERFQSIEDKTRQLRDLLGQRRPEVQDFLDRFEMSWVRHDSALEGTVYEVHELSAALHPGAVAAEAIAAGRLGVDSRLVAAAYFVMMSSGTLLAVVGTDGAAFTTVAQSSGPGANAFVRVRGDKTAATGFVGVVYEAYLEIERPVYKDGDGYGSSDPPSLVLDCVVQYDKSGPFTVAVTSTDGRAFSSNFDSPLGSYAANVGEAVPLSGSWKFPVRMREDDVTVRISSASAVPFAIQGVSWTHREFSRYRSRR